MDITIIIPVKDEAESISQLADEVSDSMTRTSFSWECLWIDDGSTDETLTELVKISKKDGHHRFLSLEKNFGQSAAMAVVRLEYGCFLGSKLHFVPVFFQFCYTGNPVIGIGTGLPVYKVSQNFFCFFVFFRIHQG